MKLSSIFSLPTLALSVTLLLISAVSRPGVANQVTAHQRE